MDNQFIRTQILIGENALNSLKNAHIAVFGVGGVGGYTVEALVRAGVEHIDIIDNDTVAVSNINRQIIATHSTVGRYKVDVMKERILDINPKANVTVHKCFYLPETQSLFDFTNYDYVVDAVDTVTAKLALITQAKQSGTRIICSMGAGNKMDPTKFKVADIFDTSVCPLARVMRQACKKRGLKDVKVVYSTEQPLQPVNKDILPVQNPSVPRRDTPGSCSFVPSVAGLIIASEVVKDLISL